ncbi:hypothetical protein KDH_74340 [Dictyobacter sp. S3.2.2.5]|uniref:HTH merR-type domain-containing protein n=1 Tax=Dictyobacter halimunensis TaxID=3026934 RepID=A0ABQ6G3Z3_9CHLR|nr:hypothetical protein KDH_74340 [Dictyobacter sp. S3.2.2.5]
MNEEREKLYGIGEVAKLTGVPIKTIRYYTDIDLLPATERTEARFRLYSMTAIWRLQLIRVLRQLEFSLEEIRAMLVGNLSPEMAIDWQLEAVGQHIDQLQRVQQVLRQAREVGQRPGQSIDSLYQLGLALSENVSERSHFVTSKLHALVEQANLPAEWRCQLLEHFTWHSPETLTSRQIAAWTEVVRLLNDPAFAEEALRFNSSSEPQAGGVMDIAEYNRQALELIQRAQSLAVQGVSPESEEAQELLWTWIRLVAVSTRRAITLDFVRELSARLPNSPSDIMQRFWTLMAELSGREAPLSYKEGFDLLASALRSLLARPRALKAVLDAPAKQAGRPGSLT